VAGWIRRHVEFPGAALFTALVKSAVFSPARNAPRAMKRRIAIGRREKQIEDRKTRTLEHRKAAPPARHPKIKTSQRLCHPPIAPNGCHSERSEESLCHDPCHSAYNRLRGYPQVKTYHVYIMTSASRVLYIGVTGDLLRRIMEHKQMRVPGFTARYRVTELAYFEAFGDIRIAIAREKQIKGWLRERKIALIESFNPRWRDLAAELQSPTPNRMSL